MAQKIVINNTGSTPKSYINESKTTLVNVKDLDKVLQAIAGLGLKYQISDNSLEVYVDNETIKIESDKITIGSLESIINRLSLRYNSDNKLEAYATVADGWTPEIDSIHYEHLNDDVVDDVTLEKNGDDKLAIKEDGITTRELANDSVEELNIKDDAVSTAKIQDSAITKVLLNDDVITTNGGLARDTDGSLKLKLSPSQFRLSGGSGGDGALTINASAITDSEISRPFPLSGSENGINANKIGWKDVTNSEFRQLAGINTDTNIQTQINNVSGRIADIESELPSGGINGDIVGTNNTQILTNKTLTNPVLKRDTGTIIGLYTLPIPDYGSQLDYLASTETTQTLKNKTINGLNNTITNVNGSDIVDNTITQAKMADNSIGTAELINSNITTVKIANNNVTLEKIQLIENAKIITGTGTENKQVSLSGDVTMNNNGVVTLTTDSVIESNITNNSITTEKILDSNVTLDKLASDSVSEIKIIDENVTYRKLSSDLQFAIDSINARVNYALDFDGANDYLYRNIQILSLTDFSSLSNFTTTNLATKDSGFFTNDLSYPYVATSNSLKLATGGYVSKSGLVIGKQYILKLVYFLGSGSIQIGNAQSNASYKTISTTGTNWQETEFSFVATGTDFFITSTAISYIQELRLKEDAGLDWNDVEMIQSRLNKKFSRIDSANSDWTGSGEHAISIIADRAFTNGLTTAKNTCGRITAAGSFTGYVQLAYDKFNVGTDPKTKITAGNKYLISFLARPRIDGTDINCSIGSKTGTALNLPFANTYLQERDTTIVYTRGGLTIPLNSTAKDWSIYFFEFTATSAEENQPLRIFLNQADTVDIDEVSITRRYDMLINIWDSPTTSSANKTIIQGKNVLNRNATTNMARMNYYLDGYSNINNGSSFNTYFDCSTSIGVIHSLLIKNGDSKIYSNGIETTKTNKFPIIKDFVNNYYLGANLTSTKYLGKIGNVQIVRFANADSLDASTIYSYTSTNKQYPPYYENGEVVMSYDFAGDSSEYLDDLSVKENDLTAVGITLADNRRRYIV